MSPRRRTFSLGRTPSRGALPRCTPTLCCLLALSVPAGAGAAAPVTSDGRVAAVTVYQGQALVTREVEIQEAQGLTELIVGNLPAEVLPASLYAEPTDGIEVRSVRYRVRPVEQDVRQEVRDLDAKLQEVADKLNANQRNSALRQERLRYLEKLESFTTGVANLELTKGVLNAETLERLTRFVFEERASIAQQDLASAVEERGLKHEQELLSRQRETLTSGSARSVREAVVFVNVREGGPKKLRLTYLVSNASWSPSYNLRVDPDRTRVTVEYNASIEQMSGEDWTDVEMTLSTATPSLAAKGPTLEELVVRLDQRPAAPPLEQIWEEKQDLARRQRSLSELRNRAGVALDGQTRFGRAEGVVGQVAAGEADSLSSSSGGGGARGLGGFGAVFTNSGDLSGADAQINTYACAVQVLEYNARQAFGKDRPNAPPMEEGVSVSYTVAGQTSLPSRSDRQLIQIASLPLEGEFYRLATPVLTEYVYEEARVVNSTDMVLLSGPAATFVGSGFVGRGTVPTVAAGERFTVGLGIDPSLRCTRELTEQEDEIQGGNRVADFQYRLAIENFGAKPVAVRLVDRIPTTKGDEVAITLVKSDQPVSDDPQYLQEERKRGILRWDVEVPAGAMGADRKTLDYTLRIEHDRQLALSGATPQ